MQKLLYILLPLLLLLAPQLQQQTLQKTIDNALRQKGQPDKPKAKHLKQALQAAGYTMPANTLDLKFTQLTNVKNWEACLELGGLLYSDNSLSYSGQTSCAASCHVPTNHLSPQGAQIGTGGYWTGEGRKELKYFPKDYELDMPKINAPSAENVIYTQRVLHDCSQSKVSQISQEVGGFAHNIAWDRMIGNPIYESYFQTVWGDTNMSEIRFQQAILTYQESFISNQTPFQRWLRDEIQLNDRQQDQLILVFDTFRCQNCHSGPGLNGEGLKMARPVNPHDFFKGDQVNTRSIYNTDAFDTFGWGGDYKRLGNFMKAHYKVLGEDGHLEEMPNWGQRKELRKAMDLFCD